MTMRVEITVPDDFQLPGIYQEDNTGRRAATALLVGATALQYGLQVESPESAAAIAAHSAEIGRCRELMATERREHAQTRAELASVREACERNAAAMCAPILETAIGRIEQSSDGVNEVLRSQVEALQAQLTERSESGAHLQSVRDEIQQFELRCTQQLDKICGSNRIKGATGESQVMSQIALLCPDSTVEQHGDAVAHSGDGLWTRFFGSANIAMRCMVEVKNVDRVRSEELVEFHESIDRMVTEKTANCALFLSLREASLPAHQGRVKYSPFFTLEWRGGTPIIYASNLRGNPDLLGVCIAAMQQVWQYCEHHTKGGADEGWTDDALRATAHLVNDFVNEQYGLHRREAKSLQDEAVQLQSVLRSVEKRRVLHQRQADNIASRISDSLSDVVSLRRTVPGDTAAAKRRRTGVAIAPEDMTADQRRITDACAAFIADGGKLRSAAVNNGEIDGVTKYEVDSLFGNFTSLRKSVTEMCRES